MTKPDVNFHDGTNYGGTCGRDMDDDFCIRDGNSGWCKSFTKGEALILVIELLEMIQEVESND